MCVCVFVCVCVCVRACVREWVVSALLSTPRSRSVMIRLKQMKKKSKLIRFYACCYLPTRASHRHAAVSTQFPPTDASHTLCASTQLLRVDAQCGCARSVHWRRSWSRKGRAERWRSCRTKAKAGKTEAAGLRQKRRSWASEK